MTQIQHLKISDLTLLERNPRKITKEQLNKLCDSIQEDPSFLEMRPILVNNIDNKYVVYAGNQRVRAAKRLKWKEVPCVVDTDLSEEDTKRRVILDNIHHGEFDYDILATDYDVGDLLGWGLTERELGLIAEIESNTVEEDNEVLEPANDADAVTKLGDVYQLNNHRLVCGDSTMPDVVEKCLSGAEPILMVTDPPYGVEYDPSWRDSPKVNKGRLGKNKANGIVQNDDKINWSLAWSLFPGNVAYVWCASWYLPEVAKTLDECEYERKSLIIWVKQHIALSRGDYHWQHEPCWYAVRKGQSHNWQGSRKESTVWEIANLNAFGKASGDGEERTAHSTQKPIECMARPIKNNTSTGEGVYDPFLGSGTTLIAAEQLDRVCFGVELSPGYCDIIVQRWKAWMVKNGKPYTIKRNGEVMDA